MLHAVNQFPIDIYLKSADVRGTDPVCDAVCVYRRWIASRHAFCVNDKSTVKLTMPSKSNFDGPQSIVRLVSVVHGARTMGSPFTI